ncbi:hypothetical protein EH223_02725 [candidate division KSB1 bacterium]|nr:hypothetical protein [candidate division KSB1 bacterium]RQW06311.1 MAG: hypothetical protein EH223_02725 [candidate division KSB1 bacterium]
MRKKKCLWAIIALLLLGVFAYPQESATIDTPSTPRSDEKWTQNINAEALKPMIKGVIDLYQFLRNDIGVYADAARFEGEQFHPCSIASVGMGLVSLCIADTLELIDDAESLALVTLQAMSGERSGYAPARNPVNGFFRHWINMNTGAREWNSEYSSIDTGILVSGALFCKQYFSRNAEIARLADALYLSVDWNTATANATAGDIYMTFDEQGKGELKIGPFNEYMIVAWLAKNDPRANVRTKMLWTNHFENAAALPNSSFEGISLLTDAPDHFLSNFVIQFPYYLCFHFTTHQDYLKFFHNAMSADRRWWSQKTDKSYIWGTGAGASGFVDSGYHADNFNNNPGTVCSPHVLAGFMPVDSTIALDILNLWENNTGVYRIPGSSQKILWRFSVQDRSWRAADVQGVDISTLLFGLAAHPAVLGNSFFAAYNDFNFPVIDHVKKKLIKRHKAN